MIRLRPGVLLCLVALGAMARAEEPAKSTGDSKEIERTARQRELDVLMQDLARSREQQARLKEEIDRIKGDRRRFAQDLLDTASRVRSAEANLSETEKRLATADQREAALKRSLADRQATLAQVLGALERIGLQPTPALILQSETTLEMVRSAILLGSLVPQLRERAESLAADLTELSRLRQEIAAERDSLAGSRAALADDQRRLSALVDERQRQQSEEEKALETEHARAQSLAKQAETVQDLVNRMEREIEGARRAAEAARREDTTNSRPSGKGDPVRITPAVPFAENKGKLAWPVVGQKLRDYGATNSLGGLEKGLTIATRVSAQVVAPCDGWVVFAGNFRNYGQLLIINVGGGYHILLAGMERITVDLGQFVLSGEPVAVMGSAPRVASVSAFGSSVPVLYVEFRKDGNSIDPSPWWATTEDEKVRG